MKNMNIRQLYKDKYKNSHKINIPFHLIKKLGWTNKDRIYFELYEDKLILHKANGD